MPPLGVAIAGAGLAGLALARILYRHEVDSVVFERGADQANPQPGEVQAELQSPKRSP